MRLHAAGCLMLGKDPVFSGNNKRKVGSMQQAEGDKRDFHVNAAYSLLRTYCDQYPETSIQDHVISGSNY